MAEPLKKERPILFSGPMVRAILEGTKTQTRRVIKPQPVSEGIRSYGEAWAWNVGKEPWFSGVTEPQMRSASYGLFKYCPYGQPGDRLWVRESFQPLYGPEAGATKPNWKTGYGYQVSYPATEGVREYHDEDRGLTDRCKPSIHMPRWASRITLEITKVRVERLQDISESDAIAEGIRREKNLNGDYGWLPAHEGNWELSNFPRNAFCASWQSINFKRGFGWEKNPWVWVVEFKRVEGRVNA